MLPQLAAALDRIGGVLRPPAFDATTLDRTFRIAAGDAQALLLGPPLLARLRALAPRSTLRFEPVLPDVRDRVETGDIDLAFALANTPLPPGAHSEPLAEDRLALVTRRGSRASDFRWTLEDYARCDHATVAIFGDRLSEIDAELAEAGLVRRIAFTTPHFLVALAAVGASDCVTTLSAALARRFAEPFGLELYQPPLRQTRLTLTTVVAATRADDPGLVWLRARLRESPPSVCGRRP